MTTDSAHPSLAWAGHSNPRHARDALVPKFGRLHGRPKRHIENIDVREGDNVTLECEADGIPRPSIHWVSK